MLASGAKSAGGRAPCASAGTLKAPTRQAAAARMLVVTCAARADIGSSQANGGPISMNHPTENCAGVRVHQRTCEGEADALDADRAGASSRIRPLRFIGRTSNSDWVAR